jgi:adenine-specific DNA-methyltransferase
MSNRLGETLEALLKEDERLVSQDGDLLKNRVQELVGSDDQALLEALYNNPEIRAQFFVELKKTSIFEKDKFLQFITAKEWLPDSYTAYKNKIGLTYAGGTFVGDTGEVILDWAFKDCILEGGMKEDEASRSEIFYNQTLAPDEVNRLLESKAFLNAKRISAEGEAPLKSFKFNEKGGIADNLIIRGNNLLGLASIRDVFSRKVKLIYIDPPYNIGGANGTSADFAYNDRFNHSTWLTFMKNRVEIARKLLAEDGIMVIQCDDNELFHLKVLLDEVFKKSPKGKSNFVQMVEIRANEGAANEYQNPFMPKNCEYLLIYAKNYDAKKYKPVWIESHIDNAYSKILLNPKEKDFHKWEVGTVKEEYLKTAIVTKCDNPSCDTLSSDQYRQFVIDNAYRIFRGIAPKGVGKGLSDAMAESKKTGGWSIYRREDNDDIYTYKGEMVRFYSKNLKEDQNGKTTITRELGSLWTDIPWTGIANEGGVKFKNGKKPEALLRRVIEMNTEPGELVLDYHLGSGTTAAVAHKMGRQYIGIEQLNYGENDATQRLKNVIAGDKTGASKAAGWKEGGEFVYLELAERNPKLLAQVEKATSTKQLMASWDEISNSPFVSHKIDLMKLKDSRSEFEKLSLEDAKSALLEMLDKNAIYINISELEDKANGLKASDIALNKAFYGLS